MMDQMITVGVADQKIARESQVLVTYALGSCVGICLYDSVVKVAGMAHILLPSGKGFSVQGKQVYKFADTAIVSLLRQMVQAGAHPMRIKAKIAGGAQMFPGGNNAVLSTIGARNIQAVEAELGRLKIPITARDVGADYGRTQYFFSDGTMKIKSAIHGEWIY